MANVGIGATFAITNSSTTARAAGAAFYHWTPQARNLAFCRDNFIGSTMEDSQMIAPPNCDVLFEFNRDVVPPPSEVLVRFANRTVANRNTSYRSDERRAETRHAIVINVLAIPLDKNFKKCGEPFTAVTRDLSASGIAMFHRENVFAKFLALEIVDPSGDRLRLIMSVLRSQAIGLFYEVAGQFVKKLGSISPTDESSKLPGAV
jgi:hypothetical protein